MLLLIRTSSISAVGHNTTRAAVTTSSSSISAQGTPPTPTASASQHTPSAPASSSSVDPQRAPPTKVPEQDPTTPKSTGQSHSGKAQSHLSAKRRNVTQDQGRPPQSLQAPSVNGQTRRKRSSPPSALSAPSRNNYLQRRKDHWNQRQGPVTPRSRRRRRKRQHTWVKARSRR